jgi:PAS domain S-box-containing protein
MRSDRQIYDKSEQLRLFRDKAEALISKNKETLKSPNTHLEMEELLHELQVFQIELEMQNDELRISHDHLEAERAKFSGLYDLAPVGYFILNKIGEVEEVNLTALQMMGIIKIQILGRRFQDYVDKDQSGEFYNLIRKMRAVNNKHNCQLKIVSGKQNFFHAQLEGTGILNKLTGDVQFYIAVIDITRRREAELRLIESNERLKMTLEASATGTWEIDLKKEIIILEESSYIILGLESWEFDGKYDSFFKLVHPEDRDVFKSQLLIAIKENRDIDTEFRLMSALTGQRFVAVRGHLLRQETNIGRFVGIIIDITDKKRLQQEADQLRNDYQKSIVTAGLQAQEKERKRISDALHDSVAQMLYGIRLSLQNSGTDLLNDPESNISELLNQAITEIRNISFELAPSLLKDFGLTESVREMAKRLKVENFVIIVKTHGAKVRYKPDLEISAFRIIQELISNSIKHGLATQTTVKISYQNHTLVITVSDNGKGFNTKSVDYLAKGSGLLSIRNRISLFNGTCDIRSAVGNGTNVVISLNVL